MYRDLFPLLSVFLSKQSQDLVLPVASLLVSVAEYLDFLCQAQCHQEQKLFSDKQSRTLLMW